jgi:uncharacterized protein YlxP (DUF503 family)
MIVGLLTLSLHLPESNSLKSKRQVIKSIKDRVGKRFNVSIAEVGGNDLWQRCDLGIALVANEPGFIDRVFNEIRNMVISISSVELINSEVEML